MILNDSPYLSSPLSLTSFLHRPKLNSLVFYLNGSGLSSPTSVYPPLEGRPDLQSPRHLDLQSRAPVVNCGLLPTRVVPLTPVTFPLPLLLRSPEGCRTEPVDRHRWLHPCVLLDQTIFAVNLKNLYGVTRMPFSVLLS